MVQPTGSKQPYLEITASRDSDSCLRLTLLGELDLATRELVQEQLRLLLPTVSRLRLDLSQLEFMDCAGFHAIASAVEASQHDGHRLEVDGRLSEPVARLVELLGGERLLWPQDG